MARRQIGSRQVASVAVTVSINPFSGLVPTTQWFDTLDADVVKFEFWNLTDDTASVMDGITALFNPTNSGNGSFALTGAPLSFAPTASGSNIPLRSSVATAANPSVCWIVPSISALPSIALHRYIGLGLSADATITGVLIAMTPYNRVDTER